MRGDSTSAVSAVRSGVRWFHRQVHGGGDGAAVVWFRVHPPHPDLWGEAPVEPVMLGPELRDRLADGLRLGGDGRLLVALAPAPRPASTLERSYAGMASLLRQSTFCLVGVPEDVADRMPWAAAGCGLIAARLDGSPTGARMRDPRETVRVNALPGWMVGTDPYGVPVVLHLPPGSTTLIRGTGAADVAATIPPSPRVPGQDVVTTGPDGWAGAWHPQRCRVVVDGSDGSCPGEGAGICADVVVDLTPATGASTGTVTVGDSRVSFTPLPLRYPGRS